MRLTLACFAIVFLLSPAMAGEEYPRLAGADKTAHLYPDKAVFALGIDVKGIMASPLGKKVIGTDKPFDATRKTLALIFPERILPVPADATGALAAVANKLDRVTMAGYLGDSAAESGAVIFLEGGATDEEYAKAAEAIAKAGEKKF